MAPKTKTPDRLTVEERRELPASAFGIPETREFPLVDAAHIRAAEAYFRYAPDDRKAALARRKNRYLCLHGPPKDPCG